MKVIKPQCLSLLTRPYEFRRRYQLGISVIAFVPLQKEAALLSEVDMWKFAAETLGKDAALDVCIPKSAAEFLVTGNAYTPDAKPQPACRVAAQAGAVRKELFVFGDRYWNGTRATDPQPFTEMPLDWSRAFGGPDYARNPLGKGFDTVDINGVKVKPLPNLEHPEQLVTHPDHKPEPTSFGIIDQMWPQRANKVGTYDDDWLKNDFPGYARDIDWTFFNLTAADQQQPSPFSGDEEYRFDNMHPTEPVVEGRLPGVLARSFVNRKSGDNETFEEVPLRLTTCWFIPHAKRVFLIYQGSTNVGEYDAADVAQIVIAAERHGQSRPYEHYHQVLQQRLDKKRGYLYGLRDQDLAPEGISRVEKDVAITPAGRDGLLQKNQRRKVEREIQQSRDAVVSQGLDPDKYGPSPLPPEEPLPSLSELPEYVAKKKQEVQEMRLNAEAELKRRQEATKQAGGVDDGETSDAQNTGPKGPPAFSADAMVSELREKADKIRKRGKSADHIDQIYRDPENLRQWKEAEEKLLEAYVISAHHQNPADAMEAEKLAAARTAVVAAHGRGESMAGWNLTGVDLSGLDLSGANLEGALMESARLEGTGLSGANLKRAVLAHATLRGTTLTGASLQGANLGAADLHEAQLDGADLSGVILAKARLAKVSMREALLHRANLMETVFDDTDLSGAQMDRLSFIENDLRGVRLAGASLKNCNFIKTDIRGVDFSGADLGEATLIGVRAAGTRFHKSSMVKTRFIDNSDLDHAGLAECNLTEANLRGACLLGCDLSGAVADRADFSECDLRGANLYRIVAREAMWTKTRLDQASLVSANLMKGIMSHADLYGTDLRGANLFGMDLSRIGTDAQTNFSEALMKRAQMLPAREVQNG